jgi:hypothetical protein
MLIIMVPLGLMRILAAITGPFEAPVETCSPYRLSGLLRPPLGSIWSLQLFAAPVASHEETQILNAFAYLRLSIFGVKDANRNPQRHEFFLEVASSVPIDNCLDLMDVSNNPKLIPKIAIISNGD